MLDMHYELWMIDVDKSTVPGHFCFYPLSKTPEGSYGPVSQLAFFGSKPPVDDFKIAGLIYEATTMGMTELNRWIEENKEFLTTFEFVNLHANSDYST